MPAIFRRHLVGKTVRNVCHCVIAEIRFVGKLGDHTDIFINRRIERCLNKTINLRPLNSTHYAMLYPQNGGRIVAIDSVTSLHPKYNALAVTNSVARFVCDYCRDSYTVSGFSVVKLEKSMGRTDGRREAMEYMMVKGASKRWGITTMTFARVYRSSRCRCIYIKVMDNAKAAAVSSGKQCVMHY